MKNTSTEPDVLYLHGGPGFSAKLERQQFGNGLPVLWWDQPHLAADTEEPFQRLVDAAAAQVAQLSERRQKSISLLASSYGAFLAAALIARLPDRIRGITITGGILDIRIALVRLGRHIAREQADHTLEAACQTAAETDAFGAFWALLGRIGSVPEFWRYYWSPAASEQRLAMSALAANGELIDLTTCEAVTRSRRSMPRVPEASHPRCPIRVLIGRCDPLAAPEDANEWRRCFPTAVLRTVETGHFPHLELPPSAWMPD